MTQGFGRRYLFFIITAASFFSYPSLLKADSQNSVQIVENNLPVVENSPCCATCKKPSCSQEGICEVLSKIYNKQLALKEGLEDVFDKTDDVGCFIKQEFQSAFNVLSEIQDLQECMNRELQCCCEKTNKNIDKCCATLSDKLDGLTDIVITDFAGTFSAIKEVKLLEITTASKIDLCCATINSKVDSLSKVIVADFAATFTVLTQIGSEEKTIESKVDRCCSVLDSKIDALTDTVETDFAQVFVDLENIRLQGETIESKLDTCCEALNSKIDALTDTVEADFAQVFTMLENISAQEQTIESKLDGCCALLDSKVDLLTDAVETDFAGTFTVLQNIRSAQESNASQLDICCNSLASKIDVLTDAVETDFSGTFTVLADLRSQENTIESKLDVLLTNTITCAHTPIYEPTMITAPGVYCLAQDLLSTLTIASNDVVLDLNEYEITIEGSPSFTVPAIFINVGMSNITIKNGTISVAGDNNIWGIQCVATNDNITMHDLDMINCAFAITTNVTNNMVLRNLHITLPNAVGALGINLIGATGAFLENCSVRGQTDASIGYQITGNCVECNNCLATNAQFSISGVSNIVMRSCTACSCGGAGFNLQGSQNISLFDCVSNGNRGIGFSVPGGFEYIFEGCSALSNTGSGFYLNAVDCILRRCTAESNGTLSTDAGFKVSSLALNCFISECIAQRNVLSGFDLSTAATGCVVEKSTAAKNQSYGFVGNGGTTENDPIFYMNNAIGNNTNIANANFLNIGSFSAPQRAFTSTQRLYGDNLASSLP